MKVGTQVPVLTPEHADGTIWADIQGDIWQPTMYGWRATSQVPFMITSCFADPDISYGPYVAVVEPQEAP